MILTGNVALESMGFKTFGFAGGRADIWEPEEDIYWGGEAEWLGDKRYSGERELENPLAAVQMGLIYVNPEGPNGQPIRARLRPRHPRDLPPHGDERRGNRRAGRRRPHLRQGHGAGDPKLVGAEPEAAPLEEMGLGWKNKFRQRQGWRHHQQRHRRRLDAEPDAGTTVTSTCSSATTGTWSRAPPAPGSGCRQRRRQGRSRRRA
jgi:catalase-peroxidase